MRSSLSIALLALPLAAWAQTPLTEVEAVRLGLSRAAFSDLTRGWVEAAEADVMTAEQIPNPTIEYGRDRTRGSPGSVEQSVHFSQTFDLSGRRALRRDAAIHRSEMVAAATSGKRVEATAEIRRRFYDVLFKQAVLRATESWLGRFVRVETIVQQLARAGEASGYDRRRLTRERETAQARHAVESADLDRARERLAAAIGVPGQSIVTATGSVLPAPPATIESALASLEHRPDLRVLAGRAEAADRDRRAAGLAHIPEVTLGVGPKWIDNGITREHGFMVTLSVPLPVFDRGEAARKRAAAEALGARAEQRLARDRAEGELRGLHRQLERLIAAATDYRAKVSAATPELLRIAEAAYRGGESSILELLDAYRGALEGELTALDLEWKAREARIEYDFQTGSIVQ